MCRIRIRREQLFQFRLACDTEELTSFFQPTVLPRVAEAELAQQLTIADAAPQGLMSGLLPKLNESSPKTDVVTYVCFHFIIAERIREHPMFSS